MFKEYPEYLAEFKAGNKTELNRIAFMHSKEVSYLKHISNFLMYKAERDFTLIKEHVEKEYADLYESTSPKEAHKKLMRVKNSYNYDLPYSMENGKLCTRMRTDLDSIHSENKRLLSATLLNIACREKYIEVAENTSLDLDYENSIREAIHKVRNNMAYNNTIDIKYVYGKETKHTIVENGGNYRRTSVSLDITVGSEWYETVYKSKLYDIEHQGVKAYVLKLKETEETDDLKLYDSTILYIKGTRDQRTRLSEYWHKDKSETMKEMIHLEEISIAVDKTSTKIYATGIDDDWAKRTLRRRQKAQMMKSLGL